VDFVGGWSQRTEIAAKSIVGWIGVGASKYHDWQLRYGKVNEHNALVPRDHWLEEGEEQAIVKFHDEYPLEGYRRLAFMMLDRDLVATSPSSVYRVLKEFGRMRKWNRKESRKGTGFVQPLKPHEHWHVDVSYLNICGTFYYLCSFLDGCSRYVVHWEIREAMNGKIERWHRSLKEDCIRPDTPLSLEDARRSVHSFVTHYNEVRLHSAIGYVTPKDKLEGREAAIFAERDRKLEVARERRRAVRQQAREKAVA